MVRRRRHHGGLVMKLQILGLFFAITVANAASIWENSLWDSPKKQEQEAAPQAVRANQAEIKASPNTFLDTRDNQLYKTITVYGTKWFAENLNFERITSACYNNKLYCKKEGRLYAWKFARDACPPGTKLPTVADWETALRASNFERTLPLYGYRFHNGDFYDYGNTGAYWTAEEKEDYVGYAYFFTFRLGEWRKEAFYKEQGNSIRCIVDDGKPATSDKWGYQ